MTNHHKLLAAITSALLACGGGGSDGGGTPAPAPSQGETFAAGAVQSTQGGLTVNGITFATAGARLTSDDTPAPVTLAGEDHVRSHVREGMIVRVRGTRDDDARGRASEIELHDLLEGQIDDRGPGRVRVSGVDVSIDDSTVVEDHGGRRIGSDDLSSGERVEISGHPDDRGGIRATSVRRSGDATELEREVRAWVVAVSGGVIDLSFARGGPPALQVDVSAISPAPRVAVGDLVEVKTRGAASPAGVWPATELHREDDLRAGAGVRAQIEGIVSAASATGLTVAGQPVVYAPGVAFVGGTIDDVVPGVKVEAEGAIGDDGVLVASRVKLRPSVRIDANVASVDAAASTLGLLGLTVHVTPSTDVRDVASLASIPAGARVEVRGTPRRDGTGVDATRVELVDEEPNDEAFLRGVVTEKTGTTGLRILGLAIDLRGAELRSHADAPMGAAAFFDAIVPGETVVKVRWRPYPASTAAAVDEAELEG
jgi:hypothetical protein